MTHEMIDVVRLELAKIKVLDDQKYVKSKQVAMRLDERFMAHGVGKLMAELEEEEGVVERQNETTPITWRITL